MSWSRVSKNTVLRLIEVIVEEFSLLCSGNEVNAFSIKATGVYCHGIDQIKLSCSTCVVLLTTYAAEGGLAIASDTLAMASSAISVGTVTS